jgi:hypothetical protein
MVSLEESVNAKIKDLETEIERLRAENRALIRETGKQKSSDSSNFPAKKKHCSRPQTPPGHSVGDSVHHDADGNYLCYFLWEIFKGLIFLS